MRVSTIIIALAGSVAAKSSSVVPVQQIGDGQIQNPVTAPPASVAASAPASVPTASGPGGPAGDSAPPAASGPGWSAGGSGPPPAVTSPAGSPLGPGYGNITSTVTGVKTITSSLIKPSPPAGSAPAGSAPAESAPAGSAPAGSAPGKPAPSATTSKPVIQTGAANSNVGSNVGLGVVALMAAFLG